MRAIGIDITIKQLDYATFIDLTNDFQYQLALSGWGGISIPRVHVLALIADRTSGNNQRGYRNAGSIATHVGLGLLATRRASHTMTTCSA